MNLTPTKATLFDGLTGFAIAALSLFIVDLARLPIESFFDGRGVARNLNDMSLSNVFGAWLFTFVAMLIVGFPVWLVYRKLGLSKLWHFALSGVVFGIALASFVHPDMYAQMEKPAQWARGQTDVRPILDIVTYFLRGLIPCVAFWHVVYRRNGLGRRQGAEAQSKST